MEHLRKADSLDVPGWPNTTDYAWRDILMEQLNMSRKEYEIFSDSTFPLQELYGKDANLITEDDLVTRVSNVKELARELGVSYEELITIARTQFINPNSHLLPKLEKLGVNFATIKAFNDGTLPAAKFKALLLVDPGSAQYGGNVLKWVKDNYEQIMGLIVLSDPTGSEDVCSFDTVEFRYALPDFDNNRLKPSEFLKLLRFIRLWNKLGWSIENTDKAIAALYPAAQLPSPPDNEAMVRTKLDDGFKELILRLAHVKAVMEKLNLKPKRDLVKLLACWSPIDTHGSGSLYRQMFLNPVILELDDVFKEDGYGNYLTEGDRKIGQHTEALQAAFNLTQEELTLILKELGYSDQTVLTLNELSSIFRHGYLARKLKLSVRELLALKAMSGIDPFESLSCKDPLDSSKYKRPAILRFIDLVQLIKRSPLKVSQLMYFLQHEDLSGKASPEEASVLAFAKTIRDDLYRINRELEVEDDPTGEAARAKIALVYGNEVTDVFFGMLNGTSEYRVPYTHTQSELEEDIRVVTDKITYDHYQKQLLFRGVMTEKEKTDLTNVAGTSSNFKEAVQALFDAGQEFFEKFPELEAFYDDYVTSDEPLPKKIFELLKGLTPDLLRKYKRNQVRQTASAAVDVDLAMMNLLLETPDLFHAEEQPKQAAIEDFLNLESQGVSVQYFFADDVSGVPDLEVPELDGVNYCAGGTTLPADPNNPNAAISAVWRWYMEVPDNGFYNLYVEADAGVEVGLTLGSESVVLSEQNGVWQNEYAIELKGGQLYAMELTVKKVKEKLVLKWESKGVAHEPIPLVYLYPDVPVERFSRTYLRLLKAVAIAEELELSDTEICYFGEHVDYSVSGKGWLNALPVERSADAATAQSLLSALTALMHYTELRKDLKVREDDLVQVFKNPAATTEYDTSLLSQLTGWDDTFVNVLCTHFSLSAADLVHLDHFIRVKEAFDIIKRFGIRALALLACTTNEPTGKTNRDLQGALRARYDESSWLKVLQPINDELRNLQRDALVAFVLHQLRQSDASRHIDTPDKLFEYFLVDVGMEPCMMTSRIKLALSSVQLFIQRCLLNLEQPRVVASSINAKQWEWMKRYRVWEANRKVFLFPENWLEPELRDDKSPFFKDLESELLQSDITEDAAATALGHYLEKLDEVAKLETCGMYYEENEIDKMADDVIHLIARTSGARRNYYYRRLEYSYWTPWEKVDADIEDNPVLPVVWKGRLFLFWLSVIQEAPKDTQAIPTSKPGTTNLTALKVQDLEGDTKIKVSVNLYYCEYSNGKWQPPKTSDVNRPISIGEFEPKAEGSGGFERANLTLSSSLGASGELYVRIEYSGRQSNYFKLYNSHSLPVRWGDEVLPLTGTETISTVIIAVFPQRRRSFSKKNGIFVIDYLDPSKDVEHWSFSQNVLQRAVFYQVIEPRHTVPDIFETPFFFQDSQYTFFVRPMEDIVSVAEYVDFGIMGIFQEFKEPDIPPILVKPEHVDIGWIVDPERIIFPPHEIRPGAVDPRPAELFLDQNIHITRAVASSGTVLYGDRRIGPGGSVDPDVLNQLGSLGRRF